MGLPPWPPRLCPPPFRPRRLGVCGPGRCCVHSSARPTLSLAGENAGCVMISQSVFGKPLITDAGANPFRICQASLVARDGQSWPPPAPRGDADRRVPHGVLLLRGQEYRQARDTFGHARGIFFLNSRPHDGQGHDLDLCIRRKTPGEKPWWDRLLSDQFWGGGRIRASRAGSRTASDVPARRHAFRRRAAIFRPEGAPTNQPRATPWERYRFTPASPERAKQIVSRLARSHVVSPFQGFPTRAHRNPGRRCALPWADLWLPLRGEGNRAALRFALG